MLKVRAITLAAIKDSPFTKTMLVLECGGADVEVELTDRQTLRLLLEYPTTREVDDAGKATFTFTTVPEDWLTAKTSVEVVS